MKKTFFLLAVFLAIPMPGLAANTVEWLDSCNSEKKVESLRNAPSGCVTVQFTTANEASEAKFLYVFGSSFTIGSDADTNTAGGETASASALWSCTSATIAACATQNLSPTGTSILD